MQTLSLTQFHVEMHDSLSHVYARMLQGAMEDLAKRSDFFGHKI